MCGRQRIGVVAEMVLAELAGVVAEVEQELGERRGAGLQVRRAAGQLRRDHAGAQRMHAGEEGIATRRAALLGVVVGEHRAFLADLVDVGRLSDHQAAMIDARLHPADIIAHDEEDVGFLFGCWASAGCTAPQNVITAVAAAITLKSNLRFTNSSCANVFKIVIS